MLWIRQLTYLFKKPSPLLLLGSRGEGLNGAYSKTLLKSFAPSYSLASCSTEVFSL